MLVSVVTEAPAPVARPGTQQLNIVISRRTDLLVIQKQQKYIIFTMRDEIPFVEDRPIARVLL
jgi:hypothetical protein